MSTIAILPVKSFGAAKQRSALKAYTPRALTLAMSITGAASVGTYLAYTLDVDTQLEIPLRDDRGRGI